MNIMPVILSGGAGSRLWPLSREHFPKQFLALMGAEKTLFQTTLLRLNINIVKNPIIVCNDIHRFIVAEQARALNIVPTRIILEPRGHNTAPALALAALTALEQNDDPILVVLPADHVVNDLEVFQTKVAKAAEYATKGKLVTFGIPCRKAETAYGYIQAGTEIEPKEIFSIAKFIEKPDLATAEKFVAEGNFYWNSGVFIFKASTFLAELKKYAPEVLSVCQDALSNAQFDLDFLRLDEQQYSHCPSISIDYAVMEHTKEALVILLEAGWNDVGSWSSLWEAQTQDISGNVVLGDVFTHDVNNSYLHSDNRMVAAIGLSDTIVVETADAVLVANKNHAQAVKDIVQKLKIANRHEADYHRKVFRPWGSYEVLIEGLNYKVKRISVNPGASLSLQLHQHRSEHWIIVHGVAEIEREGEIFNLQHNQSTYIPPQTKHRLTNTGCMKLELIEVQTGEYLGEDDITRFEDIYGRT